MFDFNGRMYPPYVEPEKAIKFKTLKTTAAMLIETFNKLGLNVADYYIDFNGIENAVVRTDQRKLHYLMYHDGMEMDEIKQAAVFAYWMLRLRPIQHITGGINDINERVVLSFLFTVVNNYRKIKGMPKKTFSDKLKKDMLYAVTYREISYDYMTLLVQSLTE